MKRKTQNLEESLINISSPSKEDKPNISLETAIQGENSLENLSELLKTNKSKIPIHYELTFKESKKKFKESFFRKELSKHQNISMLSKFLGIDRRSIHRAIKDFDLIAIKKSKTSQDYYQNIKSYKNFKDLLKGYNEQNSEELNWGMPKIEEQIITDQKINHKDKIEEMTWKQAKLDFELRYLKMLLKHKNPSQTNKSLANKIGLRPETLSRKLKKLNIKHLI
ncbi:hypothetical protein HOC01_00130 [archaeon]|jgi:DNA-binding NtrC family response regulator|nr:hypothetical protein [archaeon]MBT6698752.1 hypothetical protein [archaeon]